MPPTLLRAFRVTVAVLVTTMVAACDSEPRVSGFSRDIDELLQEGGAYVAALATLPADQLTDEEVIALGYLERASLGMGSPFRLIDFALEDARLSPEVRTGIAYGVLHQVLRREGYRIPVEVLDLVRLNGVGLSVSTGPHHLGLIERTVAQAPTAAAGEHAVRIAYEIAEAERVVGGFTASVIPHVTALVADRRRSREDAAELLRAAAGRSADPLTLLREWRRERRFEVERPSLGRLAEDEEAFEARIAPELASSLRRLAIRLAVPLPHPARPAAVTPAGMESIYLSPEAAARLTDLAEADDAPPLAPIAVALEIHRPTLLAAGAEELGADRSIFLDRAVNEERFAAQSLLLAGRDPTITVRLRLTKVQAAVFMRALNQEVPWRSSTIPSTRELETRYGLQAIRYDGVPEHWRPYYRRMLADALSELQRIVPTVTYRGLTIRFGTVQRDSLALAVHDPRTRTLHLPPRTGSGTLAHELAHDLDWQLARRRYGRSGYATDLAVGQRSADRIAVSVETLATSLVRRPGDPAGPMHQERPTEVFARGFDWLVAAALAAEGQTGGYLTSFQDPALTGYGTTRGPDVAGGAAPSLFGILDQVAAVDPQIRQGVLAAYGPARRISPDEIVRTVVRAGQGEPPEDRMDAIGRARDLALRTLSAEPCRAAEARRVGQWHVARRNLIEDAARSAVYGAVVDGAFRLMETAEMEVRPSSLLAWVQWRLHGGPEPADPDLTILEPGLEMLLHRARVVLDPGLDLPRVGFPAGRDLVLCGENPFAARGGF